MSEKLGVVIVNFINYEDTIRYIKHDLYHQKDIELLVVVVDNASPNDSMQKLEEAFLEDKKVILISNSENKGYAVGNNIGIKMLEKSGYEYILISNNDIIINDNNLLSKMINRYKQLETPAFISPIMFVNNKISKEYSAWKLPSKAKEIINSSYLLKFLGYKYLKKFFYEIETHGNLKVECLPGSFFMGKVSVFKSFGYFDEQTFLYFEETIIGFNVKKIKLNNYLLQDLRYDHLASQSIDRSFNHIKKHKILLESRCYYWKKYMNQNNLFTSILRILFKLWTFEYWLIIQFSKITKQIRS